MMDIPDYAAGIRHKAATYARNGIPAVFVYPADLRGPRWPEHIVESIYRAADRASAPPMAQFRRIATGGYR